MKNKYLEEDNGSKSSRRLIAAILTASGLGMAFVLFTLSFFIVVPNTKLAKDVMEFVLGSGVTVFLGISASRLMREIKK